MRHPLSLLLCGLLACPLLGIGEGRQAAEDRKVITVGGDFNYPPYEFLDATGKPAGFNVELTRAIADVMDLPVDIRLGDWNDMRRALAEGTVDVLEGMAHSNDRSKVFDFSTPHCYLHQSIFARRGSQPVNSLTDLSGKQVAVKRGGVMQDLLANNGTETKLILVDTEADALRMVAAGKLDYALVNTLTGNYFILDRGLTNIIPVSHPVAEMACGYAVKKGERELLQEFEQGLQILINTGRYQQIQDKWLGILDTRPNPWPKVIKYGTVALVTLLAVLGSILAWSWSLRKKIEAYISDSQIRQEELIQAGKMASLGILVSGVAHEINNPTGLILYNLPLLRNAYRVAEKELESRFEESGDFPIGGLKYSELREEIPRMFDEMQGGANRIKRIVEDLKDFARKDTSSLKELIDLNTIVQTSVRLLDSSIRKATSHFHARYLENLPLVLGNAQRIEQVVVNLLLNACQALEGPDQGIYLSTSYDSDQKVVVLTIEDEGVGIPPEHLVNLTDPFFTTKRESGGTGLGLSVSAGIVKDHQGRLEFQSAPGEGTTATLTLPILERG